MTIEKDNHWELEYFTDPEGRQYTDKEHPLKLIPWTDEAKAYASYSLREAFNFAHQCGRVETEGEWAKALGLRDAKSIRDRLNNPSMMTKRDVERTCELFGCTVEWLRGFGNNPNAGAGYIALIYEMLGEDLRGLLMDHAKHLFAWYAMRGNGKLLEAEAIELSHENDELRNENERLREEIEKLRGNCGD